MVTPKFRQNKSLVFQIGRRLIIIWFGDVLRKKIQEEEEAKDRLQTQTTLVSVSASRLCDLVNRHDERKMNARISESN